MIPLLALVPLVAGAMNGDGDEAPAGGGVTGSIAPAITGLLDGILNQNDVNQFAEQLNMGDPSNLAYVAWAKEFAPQIASGAASLWDGPQSITTFRATASIPFGGDWSRYIGKFGADMKLRPETAAPGAGGVTWTEGDQNQPQPPKKDNTAWYVVAAVAGTGLLVWIVYMFRGNGKRRRRW